MMVYEGVSKSFRTESITKYKLTTINTRWEATRRVMAANLTRLTHKIAIRLHLVAESCTACSSRFRRPVRKLVDTLSHGKVEVKLHAFLTSELNGGEWSYSRCDYLTSGEGVLGSHWAGGPRAGLSVVRKSPCPCRVSNLHKIVKTSWRYQMKSTNNGLIM
jgi:hypothetical protein